MTSQRYTCKMEDTDNIEIKVHCQFFILQKLMLPLSYIQQIPGKQIRSKLILAFNNWLQIPPNKLREVGEIVQMLHNASLL